METIVMIIMGMVICSFLLKLTFHGWTGRIVLCFLISIFIIFSYELASTQSKTQIAEWLSQPELMLDTSVWLTIDVALQIWFCILYVKSLGGNLSKTDNILLKLLLWIPGLLIFPVIFAILTQIIFMLPGFDFSVIGWSLATSILVVIPLMTGIIWQLIPETEIRIELFFMLNLLIVALGIMATVNGRTAVTGTNTIEWSALAGVMAIMLAGLTVGIPFFRYLTNKNISKLK